MDRFFFHIRDGRDEPDYEGTELADWHAARRHAVDLAGRILEDKAHLLALGETWHLEVTNEVGLIFFRLDFQVTLAPMLLHSEARAGRLPLR